MTLPAFRTVPIDPIHSRHLGLWKPAVEAARAASLQGNAIEMDADAKMANSARASLYHGRYLRPGEKIHLVLKDGVLRIWLTFDKQNGAQS